MSVSGISKKLSHKVKRRLDPFFFYCSLAKRLLFEEKIAAGVGMVSKTGTVNERVDPLRRTLFGKRMNHGGFCGALFDLIDPMLLDLIRGGGGGGAASRLGHCLWRWP